MKMILSLLLTFVMLFFATTVFAEDWNCPTCSNQASGNFCNNCGSAKPDNGNWICGACGADASGKFCSNCGYPKASVVSETASIPIPTVTPALTVAPVVAAKDSELSDAAMLLAKARSHMPESINPSPDKDTYYIQDYVGLNLSSIGYTSMGGNRFDRYGTGLLEVCPVTLDGTYVDIEDEDVLSQYVVVAQNLAPNTELKLVYQKDSEGKEYSNLIDYQSISSIDLLVVRIDGVISERVFPYTPVAIQTAPDRYTNYVRNYVGKNLATVGYTSMGGDRLDVYHSAYIELCPVTVDGTYIDIEDSDLLQQYVVVGQNVAPNTEIKLVYQKDSEGKEYSNLIEFCNVELIDLQVVRIDSVMYNDAVTYEPVTINASADKYTWYIRNYVGKNLASVGYTSLGGQRMDEYGDACLELVLVTPDRSAIDLDDSEQLASYVVVSQDVAPNTEMRVTYLRDSEGKEYSNLVDQMSYKKITLTLQKVNSIPDEEVVVSASNEVLLASTAAPVETHFSGPTYTARDFEYVIQSDNTAVIIGYTGKGSSVSVPSDLDGHDVSGIGPSVFENHSEITSIAMWADPTFIGERAFMGCTKLKEISISSDCEMIGASAFEGCTKLRSALLWGDSEIAARAFFGCINLKEISIGNDTELIGESAFEGCTDLESALIWGDTNIGDRAFYGCISLKEISIDSDTEYIGDYAFYGCTSLKDAIVWGKNTRIGFEAFGDCPKLEEVTQFN